MATDREELTELLHAHLDSGVGETIDAILAAGYRKVEPQTEWGVQSKWGQHWFENKDAALANVALHESCKERATLIKRSFVTELGPWVVADDER